MKTLFFGTPAIAVPYLQWLASRTQVAAVVCRPDEPAGRGHEIKAPPVKVAAQELGLPVFQPEGPWQDSFISQMKNAGAELGVIVAYGRILPESVFLAPKHGCINLHFSLLPKFRGAAPMQWSLIKGEKVTGVTAFWLEKGLDTGPIFHQSQIPVDPADNAVTLREKLVPLGVEVLARVVADAEKGNIIRTPQAGEPTFAPPLKKEDGLIRWNAPASEVINLIRGVVEWPGARTSYVHGGAPKMLKIVKTAPAPDPSKRGNPGEITAVEKNTGLWVSAADAGVLVTELQPEGKKAMPAAAWWQGSRLNVGDRFGND